MCADDTKMDRYGTRCGESRRQEGTMILAPLFSGIVLYFDAAATLPSITIHIHNIHCMYVVGATVTLDMKVHGQTNFLRFVFCFVVRIRWYRQCIEKWREGINATCKYSRVTADG